MKPRSGARSSGQPTSERTKGTPLAIVREDALCRRLMTVPGVGPLVAITHKTAMDDPNRIAKSKAAGALFGLTPKSCHEPTWRRHFRLFVGFPFCGYDFRSLFRLSRLVGLAKPCLRPSILFVVKRTLPRSSLIELGRRSASVEPQKPAASTPSDGLPKPLGNGVGWLGPIQFQIETLIARIIQPSHQHHNRTTLRHQGRQ